SGEAANANSMDEVTDSAWFENHDGPLRSAQQSLGACKPADLLPVEVADGAWVIEHGKDNGATPGFRVDIPGMGLYLLNADDPQNHELVSSASVIGAAIYDAYGFAT